MKRVLYYIFIFFVVISVSSCNDKKKSDSRLWEKRDARIDDNMQLSKEDTMQVLSLAKEYLDLLKENRIDEALSKLYEVKGDTITLLSDDRKKQLASTFVAFPVLSYQIKEVLFYSDMDTEVRYVSTFFEKSEGDNRPNTIQCVINPKRISNVWYITVSDKTREP